MHDWANEFEARASKTKTKLILYMVPDVCLYDGMTPEIVLIVHPNDDTASLIKNRGRLGKLGRPCFDYGDCFGHAAALSNAVPRNAGLSEGCRHQLRFL